MFIYSFRSISGQKNLSWCAETRINLLSSPLLIFLYLNKIIITLTYSQMSFFSSHQNLLQHPTELPIPDSTLSIKDFACCENCFWLRISDTPLKLCLGPLHSNRSTTELNFHFCFYETYFYKRYNWRSSDIRQNLAFRYRYNQTSIDLPVKMLWSHGNFG